MKTLSKLLAVALVGVLAFTGFAAATGGVGFSDSPAASAGNGFGVGDGTGPMDAGDADRPLDGSNSPWVTGDERLDRFQERFDLTDEQMTDIREAVLGLLDDGATHDEIRAAITEKLTEFGVEDPVLGPTDDDRQHLGPFGNGHGGNGPGHGNGFGAGAVQGQMHGQGPYGPADGSCLN